MFQCALVCRDKAIVCHPHRLLTIWWSTSALYVLHAVAVVESGDRLHDLCSHVGRYLGNLLRELFGYGNDSAVLLATQHSFRVRRVFGGKLVEPGEQ